MPKSVLAGSIAAICAKTALCPLDRTKLLYQTKNPMYDGMKMNQIFRSIYTQEGFRGYFRGNLIQTYRMIPYGGIMYGSFEVIHDIVKRKTNGSKYSTLVAGSLQGIVTQSTLYPFDILRTRFSSQHSDKIVYRNIYKSIISIYSKDGIRGFYNGMGVTLVGIVPYGGISFFTYHELKKNLSSNTALNGAAAGLLAQTCSYPIDLVRRRIQLHNFIEGSHFQSSVSGVIKDVYQKDGLLGFFRGVHMNWIRVVPASAISWTVYETLKNIDF